MKEILIGFFSGVGQKLVMLLLVGTTALTTGSAVSKLVNHSTNTLASTKTEALVETKTTPEPTPTIEKSDDPTPEPTKTIKKIIALVTPTPTIIPAAVIPLAKITPKPTPSTSSTSKCIITLFSQQFDVTTLRTTHSGGDIFKCGTDMTSVYQAKHGTSLARMAPYAINSGSPSTVGNQNNGSLTPTPSPTSFQRDGDDREDQEHRDRYIEEQNENIREEHDD